MIYQEPRSCLGGRYVLIEFGNEMNLELNFTAQGLADAIEQNRIGWVVETAPCSASMLVHYDPQQICCANLKTEMISMIGSLGRPRRSISTAGYSIFRRSISTRRPRAVDDHRAKIEDRTWDPEFIAELNGLSDVQQFVRVHSGTEYWVASLGFRPGLPVHDAARPALPADQVPHHATGGGTVKAVHVREGIDAGIIAVAIE